MNRYIQWRRYMEDKKDYELFPGKTLSNLFEDIYKNSENTGDQVGGLVDQLKKFVKNLDSAVVIVPLIREYLDVKVKSDEHLVKLSDTIQRLLRTDKSTGETQIGLTEEERKQLLEDVPTYEEIRDKDAPSRQETKEEADEDDFIDSEAEEGAVQDDAPIEAEIIDTENSSTRGS